MNAAKNILTDAKVIPAPTRYDAALAASVDAQRTHDQVALNEFWASAATISGKGFETLPPVLGYQYKGHYSIAPDMHAAGGNAEQAWRLNVNVKSAQLAESITMAFYRMWFHESTGTEFAWANPRNLSAEFAKWAAGKGLVVEGEDQKKRDVSYGGRAAKVLDLAYDICMIWTAEKPKQPKAQQKMKSVTCDCGTQIRVPIETAERIGTGVVLCPCCQTALSFTKSADQTPTAKTSKAKNRVDADGIPYNNNANILEANMAATLQ